MFSNERADWLGKLICDVRPDVVVCIGDAGDFHSLYQVDKGKKSFQGKTYAKDLSSFLDFQDRVWGPTRRQKKKFPRSVFCIGNHEQRIVNAVELQPELEGTIGINDLELNRWYDDVVHYEGHTPGTIEIDGVIYGHYFTSGVLGRPFSGEHTAYSMVGKNLQTSTMGHSHLFDLCVRTRADGRKVLGCTVGCYQDYTNEWAGEIGKLWDRGILVKHGVEDGVYDPEWVSLTRIIKEYKTNK
jgi:hypothetical protein